MSDLFTLTKLQIAPAQSLTSSGGLPSWAWFIIIVFIILLVWWLLVRSAEEQNEIHAHNPEERAVEAQSTPDTPPMTEKTAAVQIPDDLTLLEGIGPKVNSILASAGITSFSQLAETDVNKLKEILDAAGFKYMDPTTWPDQARFLAEGKNEDFEKLVSSLKGGRKK
jgi:predicted flap endonuclease-1-like 5' DNA nuclease